MLQNLAVDEWLAREAARIGRRVLRLWWGSEPTAVLGCGDKPAVALNLDECLRHGIGWVRRVTGGGTVLQAPRVFNYSYTAPDNGLLDLGRAFGLGTDLVRNALHELGIESAHRGISDVAVGDLKVSGNAQARKWKALILHGTLLVDLDLSLMEAILRHPPKEPEYRCGRSHEDFVVTLAGLGVRASKRDVEVAFTKAAAGLAGSTQGGRQEWPR